jgi:hypothetical protein
MQLHVVVKMDRDTANPSVRLAIERHQKRRSNTEAPDSSINITELRAQTLVPFSGLQLDIKHWATCEHTAQHL